MNFNIDNFFDDFVEQTSNISFDIYHDNDNLYNLNQSVVNNMYTLRRNLELYDFTTTSTVSTFIPTPNRTRNTAYDTVNHIINNTVNHITDTDTDTDTDLIDNIFDNIFDTFLTFVDDTHELQDLQDLQDIKVVLNEQEFSKLTPIILKEMDIVEDCSICLCECTTSDKLIKLKCNHIYHRDCINKWLTQNSTKCCVCRKDTRNYL